jgi:hypothetical protein
MKRREFVASGVGAALWAAGWPKPSEAIARRYLEAAGRWNDAS